MSPTLSPEESHAVKFDFRGTTGNRHPPQSEEEEQSEFQEMCSKLLFDVFGFFLATPIFPSNNITLYDDPFLNAASIACRRRRIASSSRCLCSSRHPPQVRFLDLTIGSAASFSCVFSFAVDGVHVSYHIQKHEIDGPLR
ncbi:polynucleotidyl transferase [Striga asiatica]|uniref:Polynucleotidyl transferase n=1 Tax=Striga asiatica TaxID=4170 RepID=A0A5A7PGU5_STRAF|nr:polynucleotidyl transferase [Striga asiatica]